MSEAIDQGAVELTIDERGVATIEFSLTPLYMPFQGIKQANGLK